MADAVAPPLQCPSPSGIALCDRMPRARCECRCPVSAADLAPSRIPWWHRTVSGIALAAWLLGCVALCAGVCWAVDAYFAGRGQ